MSFLRTSLCALTASALGACATAPEGLRLTPDGTGPLVVVDWEAQPLPDIPFPNDLATRSDPTSITGLRLNISQLGVTQSESEARAKLNELVGFGIYAPISVAFDAQLDLDEIVARHPDDFETSDPFSDDAFYIIDVEPSSPYYLEPVALDIGHGRYPVDIEGSGRYFANDPRSDAPTLMFETVDEDLDGDGELDWGEDSDNDGVLDTPNVYPLGGDPRDDLLTFYERQTNTLILRPVVPLREENRYAVVLTERLTGEGGQPVRSPWTYVNHTRQTDALQPVLDALPQWDLTVDDVAYAWVFTTGRVTGDLVDIRRGFDGEGPWPHLGNSFPAGVNEALQIHDLDQYAPQTLPMEALVGVLVELGLFDGPEGELLSAAYEQYGANIVGGSYTTPYLLADRDDDGRDDSDEWWQLDPQAGTMSVQPQRVAFTCVLPKVTEDATPPFPVAIFGHGHGSSRFDSLQFGWALNRLGIASCGMDFPGHGPSLDPTEEAMVEALLPSRGLLSFYHHLKDARDRDLTNDGTPDSGGDQWIADPFHTRDMVRQAVVDWMQLIRSFQACGSGTMQIVGSDGQVTGQSASCDWDEDGIPDLGGPDVEYYIYGGSLGGINTSVAAGVMPEVSAWSPIVPGGGLMDTGIRSDLGGVIAAVVGRMLTPLILGLPTKDGGLQVVQLVNAYADMETVPIATLDSIPSNGRVVVYNLNNGEVREGWIPEDGSFRVAIPADAMDPLGKRLATGMPDEGPEEGEEYSVTDNIGLGDLLIIDIFDADDQLVTRIDSWEEETLYEGVTMEAGSPLVAASHGSGHIRGTPELRRLVMAMALVTEPADPIAYAPHWFEEPFGLLGGQPANVLLMPTIGDQGVSISTGIAIARAAGLVEWRQVDDRYGMTPDQWLIDRKVVHGLEEYGPYIDAEGNPALFDPDDLDQGTDGTGAPSEEPLRATVETRAGESALRLPYPQTTGRHGFNGADLSEPFTVAVFAANQISTYFASKGEQLRDDLCMGTETCDFLPEIVLPEEKKKPKKKEKPKEKEPDTGLDEEEDTGLGGGR